MDDEGATVTLVVVDAHPGMPDGWPMLDTTITAAQDAGWWLRGLRWWRASDLLVVGIDIPWADNSDPRDA